VELLALIAAAAVLLYERARSAGASTPARVAAVVKAGVQATADDATGPLAQLGLTRQQSGDLGAAAAVTAANVALLPLHTFNAVTLNVGGEIILLGAVRLAAEPVGRSAGTLLYTGEPWHPGAILEGVPDAVGESVSGAVQVMLDIAERFGVNVPAQVRKLGEGAVRDWLRSQGVPV